MNSRRAGSAEAGNGTVTNAAGGIWNSNATATSSNFIFASNQGAGDTGAGAVFTNQGTFNKQGAAITEVRTAFNNTGSIDVQAGQLQFGTGGALTHNGTMSVASGAILDFASAAPSPRPSTPPHHHCRHAVDHQRQLRQLHPGAHHRRHRHLPAELRPGHGREPDAGPDADRQHHRWRPLGCGHHHGAGQRHHQRHGLRLDGGRIFRNEGTLTQTNANVDMNSRRAGSAEAGNGTVTNAVGGIWNSNATAASSNFILASNQGAGDTGAGAVFTNQGTFNKQGAAITEVRTAFNNTGLTDVQAGLLRFTTNGTQGTGTLRTSGGNLESRAPAPPATSFHNTAPPAA